MGESAPEVLYEARNHASRPYTYNYPPLPQANSEGAKGGILSLLSFQGFSQFKDKWSEYRHPRKIKKQISLFVSPRGERVAVAVGNQITILRTEDNYQEPFGLFSCSNLGSFTSGAWSEAHDVLGLVDDTDTLYFIKANGEEITRLTKRQTKVSSPVLGLIVHNGTDAQRSCLCTFNVLTSDGFLHVDISQDWTSSLSSRHTSNSGVALKRQLPCNVFCFDYHQDSSLLVIVGTAVSIPSNGNPGLCFLSIWKKSQNFDLHLLFSIELEGIFCEPKGYVGQPAYPKVLMSPQGKHVAALDFNGCIHIFVLNGETSSLSMQPWREISDSAMTDNLSDDLREVLRDIVDFTWWSDRIITLIKRSNTLTMFDILSGLIVKEKDRVSSVLLVERAHTFESHLFLLKSLSEERETSGLHHMEHTTEFDISRLHWSLVSLSERSVPDMYSMLINKKKYQDAMEFASSHGLDKDEVLKSQWLHSDQGVHAINTIFTSIKDKYFVLSECVEKVGATEDAVKALLGYGLRLTSQYTFSESENHEQNHLWDFRMARLQLLQFSDRLETYLGINMGRFSMHEFSKFRVMPIEEAAVTLSETGKIGALNLLFKRHPYSLAPSMLQILAAIPETVPVQTYLQLLPGKSRPASISIREEDWVECDRMVRFINSPDNHGIRNPIKTEAIVKRCLGSFWPSTEELLVWYKNRAIDIDANSGQLNNSLCLIDLACKKGINELEQFREDISYLHELIYSDKNDTDICSSMTLDTWENLSDYEKFKTMLKAVEEQNLVDWLSSKAIPFMRSRFSDTKSVTQDHDKESFLVRWLKEIALENKLDICLIVVEEGCSDLHLKHFFKDEVEAVECVLQCIYLCTVTDKWSTLAAILSKLPQKQDPEICVANLEKRYKSAEGHIEAGRLLAFYQVPKPIRFFLDAHTDEKGVKQIFRLMLSKFIRRQPGRSDNDWTNMWRDLQFLQEKAFPFIDLEYMLLEFCRGLLKAGKFSLARNYLKGTGSVALPSEKAESLIIQAAKEYFFSASSLTSAEIWKAKECLSLFSSSRNVKVEADMIEALTVKLPNLGVTLLPMQFRQIKDPMEIIQMAITTQAGAYLHVEELIDIAKLLGLSSFRDISTVEEAIAREAAVSGDLQLAFDLCLVLAKKGHGPIWDLCAAIARGPALQNMEISSRKQLLGFALSHCDDESIGDLLHVWKDLDLQGQCETLVMLTGIDSPNFSVHGSSVISSPGYSIHDIADLKDSSRLVEGVSSDDQEDHLNIIRNTLAIVSKNLFVENGTNWESLLKENGKILSFAALQLPWLLELSREEEHGKKNKIGTAPGKQYASVKATALVTILSWLVRNGFTPRDNLIASLAKSIMEPPVTEEEDIIGCSFLLNLVDAFSGVEVIEEQLSRRENYQEIRNIMNVGMTYSLLHNSGVGCKGPAQRRELLLSKFKEKHTPLNSDKVSNIDKVQSTFWREWKMKLEEKMHVADRSRILEQIIPGVETERFLSGDVNYIESVVFSLIESVKWDKKQILKDVVKLAEAYNIKRAAVILRYLSSILVSDVWTNDDIMAEVSEIKEELIGFAPEIIKTLSLTVYPEVDGCNKVRLSYIFGLFSDCYVQLEESKESVSVMKLDQLRAFSCGSVNFYKILEQECRRVSFIKNLNFKNIAGLDGLNLRNFSSEIYAHINKYSLEALAKLVMTFNNMYTDGLPEGLIPWQDVHKKYVISLLQEMVDETRADFHIESPEKFQGFISQLEQAYDSCREHIRILEPSESLDIVKQFFTVIIPLYGSYRDLPDNSAWQDCLIFLMNFWIRLTEEMVEFASSSLENVKCNPECTMSCLKVLMRLVMEDSVSPSQAWGTILSYLSHGLLGDFSVELFSFCKAMVYSGCGFGAISEVVSEALSQHSVTDTKLQDLPDLYLNILEPILQDLVSGSHEHQKLHQLLSSLGSLEGDLDELKRVRNVVWERVASFSENLQLPSQVRVYALELMQFISGRSIKGSSFELQSDVLPWEGWNESLCTSRHTENTANQRLPDQTDTSNRFTSTLVALKSSNLAASISPDIKIMPDDLLTVETALSCFQKLCAAADTDSHVDALLAILEEWEGLFVIRNDEVASVEEAGNNWGGDDWDEGWESFQEEVDVTLFKQEKVNSPSLHPLHTCWLEIFQKLITLCRYRDILRLIDQSLAKCNGVLVDENGAGSLIQTLLEMDCFLALKMALLLSYKPLRMHCLNVVEEKLKQGGIPDILSQDHELLLLLLSSQIISTIIQNPTFGTVFSYLCYMIGNLSRKFQETDLSRSTKKGMKEERKNEKKSFLFRRILFPSFLSALVKADQEILAGFLVTKYMHTNLSLSLINVTEASLHMFFKRQLYRLENEKNLLEETSCDVLLFKCTALSLRDGLGNDIHSAISLLGAEKR